MRLRKYTVLLLFTVLFFSIMIVSVQAQDARRIGIYLDGQEIKSDVSPYILPKAGVTLVPLRVISEGLGAGVDWTQRTKTVTISWPATTIKLTVGQPYAYVKGSRASLGVPVESRLDRVMVPLRFVGEQLGLKVNWNPSDSTISLISPGVTEPAAGDGGEAGRAGLRGVWVSTVFNLDWPTTGSYGNSLKQQEEFRKLLDDLQAIGMNTVFVQIRPAGDALYPSSLVPWSRFLTGTSGKAPDYDPLAFMIDETHKRGMEFHAWFNPFRATESSAAANVENLADSHVVKQHPEWIVNSNNKLYINPGIPAARQHIIDAIMEVVDQYEVDGVHLDDYFYPTDAPFSDDLTFRTYNDKQIAGIADWRRDNINEFVRQLGESIHSAKPQVQFGISPFGVWRNKAMDPTGSDTRASITAFDSMYADVRTWVKQEWIDYVIPQIYWSFSFDKARYDTLVDWWANEVRGTNVKLYIGHAGYKLGTSEAGWQSAQELIDQLQYSAALVPEVSGDVFISAKDLRKNPLGLIEALQAYYKLK
ncbi:family 10 glycosylhydrolase [Paenibacillus sp. sptzw28]|uniref:family 10 glycosylhydrolase n=1 Tax=Paenibacillus sp. sptzw28 TaxID=715179 RepID=UPI001C6EDB16|nr:family 10 glycosylhydrolase [Paenibacillus sp. sptzw28]QYR24146.1 family 10 glycosylhydrolase [Paenibacillus sp. sptzw28]